IRPVMQELDKLLQLKVATLAEASRLLQELETTLPGPQGGGMAPAGFGPTAAAGGGFGGNSAGMHKYTITYNVNSLQAMEDIQRREAAKMKDDELRRRKFGSAPEQSTPPTTLRLQRSF
ncbi:MAG TPA: hypothetical protein VMW79_11535, partial [Anaerolineae bacterium]|nr:hypothetical protein [Anaerolineae bacterium]